MATKFNTSKLSIQSVSGALAAADGVDGDVILKMRVNLDDSLMSLLLFHNFNDSSAVTGTVNIGFYRIAAGETVGAIIDEDEIGTAIDIATDSVTVGTQIMFETKVLTDLGKTIRTMLGSDLSGINDQEAWLVVTANSAITADTAGTICMVAHLISK